MRESVRTRLSVAPILRSLQAVGVPVGLILPLALCAVPTFAQPLPFVTLQLQNDDVLTGISLTDEPQDSFWVVFSTGSKFRKARVSDVNKVVVGNIDSMGYRRISHSLEQSLASVRLRDGTLIKSIFPIEVLGDTVFSFIAGGRKNNVLIGQLSSITFQRERSANRFPVLGLEYGAGLGCVWGVFLGREEIPFGSRQESIKSFNQKIFGVVYNGAVWAVIGGGVGLVVGFFAEKAGHSTATQSLDGLNASGSGLLLREVVSMYND